MTVSRDGTFALSVSADHLVGRYNLSVRTRKSCLYWKIVLTARGCRRLNSQNYYPLLAQPTEQSILGMALLVSVTTDVYVQSAVGMEGAQTTRTTCSSTATHLTDVHLGYVYTQRRRSNPLGRSCIIRRIASPSHSRGHIRPTPRVRPVLELKITRRKMR